MDNVNEFMECPRCQDVPRLDETKLPGNRVQVYLECKCGWVRILGEDSLDEEVATV